MGAVGGVSARPNRTKDTVHSEAEKQGNDPAPSSKETFHSEK